MADSSMEDFSGKELGRKCKDADSEKEEVSSPDLEGFVAGDQEVLSGNFSKGNRRDVDNGDRHNILSKISTGRSTASSWIDPGPPPDGGFAAWTQVAMGHLVIFNTWGYVSAYGPFQTYYSTVLNRPPSDISWIGSVQIFLLFFIGTASGRATDAGLFRHVFFAGIAMQLLGMFATSFCTKYWQLFVAQGICTGIGNGLQFCPSMALVSTYFSKNRSFAIGITAMGSVTGGIAYLVILRQLLPKIGFGWTVRVMGFVTLATSLVTAAFMKTRLPPRKAGPLVEWAAFKEATYVLYCIGMFLNFWGLYFAFYYVGAFGRNVIGVSYGESINLLMAMLSVGYVGRLVPNYFADRTFGPLNTIIPFAFGVGIATFGWAGVRSTGGLYAFSIVYGLLAAGIQSMFPATLSSLTTDLKKAGVRMGMCFSIVSVASLTGSPLAGALLQKNHGDYLYAQMWAGAVLCCGGLTLVAARIAKTGFHFRQRI